MINIHSYPSNTKTKSVSFFISNKLIYSYRNDVVVVVAHPPHPPKNCGWVQQPFYAHRSMLSPHLTRLQDRQLTGGPLHSTSRCPTSTGAVHKSVTCSCVFMLVQLNKCFAVCGSDLERGHSGDGCLTSSILFNYERSKGHCWF